MFKIMIFLNKNCDSNLCLETTHCSLKCLKMILSPRMFRCVFSDSLDVLISYRPFFWLPLLLGNNTYLTVFEMSPKASLRPLSKTKEVETLYFSRRVKVFFFFKPTLNSERTRFMGKQHLW